MLPELHRFRTSFVLCCVLFALAGTALAQVPPATYDLRNVNGEDYVTSVKSQEGGTCWTFGTMSAVESNLLMTGAWTAAKELGEPNLAEYHLDWWNGFNKFNNDDTIPPSGGGLTVHQGGDYRVSSAYLVRGEGAVRDIDAQSYLQAPERFEPTYHYYYVRHIEWYTAGSDLSNIDAIKEAVMNHGAVGTCMCYDSAFLNGSTHYQPPSSSLDPNHAIAIIGWNDNKSTQASKDGAWLCKNSWGAEWGEDGFFWISYYDKHSGKHPEMGAISFQDVEANQYAQVYYHDYHGWRDTLTEPTEAFNAFTASALEGENFRAVSFFTAADDVTYTAQIYDGFSGGQLQGLLASQSGVIEHSGFHTVDLDSPLWITPGDDFYVYVYLSDGGHPYDRTSDVPVLLGGSSRVTVESSANPGESFYMDNGVWEDLYDLNNTANFCIKALSSVEPPVHMVFPDDVPLQDRATGLETRIPVEINPGLENYAPGTGMLHYRFDPADNFSTIPFTSVSGNLYEAVIPHTRPGDQPEYYLSAQGDQGGIMYEPKLAPLETYSFLVYLKESLMLDTFETDMGWTVWNMNLQSGAWEIADPEGTDAQPEDDHSDVGTKCFVTGRLGGAAGADDVDGGPSYLTSPPIDLSDGDGIISFHIWFHHSNTGKEQPLWISVANNGISFVKVKELHHSPEWNHIGFKASTWVPPTDNVQVQFRIWDYPNDDIVEGLLDDFKVEKINYMPTLWADAYTMQVGSGGQVQYSLDVGPGQAHRPFAILGSLSGILPGLTLPGGAHLRLNWDSFTELMIASYGSPAFTNFMGNLDAQGKASAGLNTMGPVDPALVGQEINFAYILLYPMDFASNPVKLMFDT